VHSQPHTVLIEIQTNYLHTLDYRQITVFIAVQKNYNTHDKNWFGNNRTLSNYVKVESPLK